MQESADATAFAYLCPNGTLQTISQETVPCVWLRQPWPVIISNSDRSVELSQRLGGWLSGTSNWQTALREILTADNLVVVDSTIQSPRDAFGPCKSWTLQRFLLHRPYVLAGQWILLFIYFQIEMFRSVKRCVLHNQRGAQFPTRRKKSVKLFVRLASAPAYIPSLSVAIRPAVRLPVWMMSAVDVLTLQASIRISDLLHDSKRVCVWRNQRRDD